MNRAIAALLLAGLLSACGPSTSTRPSPTAAATPSSSATAQITPETSPTAPPGFGPGPVTGGTVSGSSVTAVRVGQQSGYDRFVIEFSGGIPSYSVTPQTSATFTRSPRGDQVTLEGTSGVLIVLHSVTNWTSYPGATLFLPRYHYLRQAMQVENYEGYQQWAIGIQGTACVRITILASPDRLVVDVVGI